LHYSYDIEEENKMSESKAPIRRRRGSLFGPLLLIALGVIFLLNNINVLRGDVWNTILQLWPVVLIVIGLDNLYQREGLVGAIFLIGLGVVFLLSNLGYISVNIWRLVLSLWPLLLVAIGLDLVVGRRNLWASLAGLLVLLALLAGALWLFGVGIGSGQSLEGERVQRVLESIDSAQVNLDNGAGDVYVHAGDDPDLLVTGQVINPSGMDTREEYSANQGRAVYRLHQTGASIGIGNRVGTRTWDLGLNKSILIDLRFNQGAGASTLELVELQIDSLDASMGVGQMRVVLPGTGDFQGKVDGAIGQIVIEVPAGVGVRIRTGVALVNVSVPGGYQKRENVYTSPDYESAETQIELQVNLAIGNVVVREID
jgi:hypothetical protein